MTKPIPPESFERQIQNQNPEVIEKGVGEHPREVGLGAFLVGGSTGIVGGLLAGPVGVVAGVVIGALAGACGGEKIGEMTEQGHEQNERDTYTTRPHYHSQPPVDSPPNKVIPATESKQVSRREWAHFEHQDKELHEDSLPNPGDS